MTTSMSVSRLEARNWDSLTRYHEALAAAGGQRRSESAAAFIAELTGSALAYAGTARPMRLPVSSDTAYVAELVRRLADSEYAPGADLISARRAGLIEADAHWRRRGRRLRAAGKSAAPDTGSASAA